MLSIAGLRDGPYAEPIQRVYMRRGQRTWATGAPSSCRWRRQCRRIDAFLRDVAQRPSRQHLAYLLLVTLPDTFIESDTVSENCQRMLNKLLVSALFPLSIWQVLATVKEVVARQVSGRLASRRVLSV